MIIVSYLLFSVLIVLCWHGATNLYYPALLGGSCMITYGLIIIIFLLFVLQKWRNKSSIPVDDKTVRLYCYFKRFFIIAPIIAIIIFAILFLTVLTGRFNERCSHALIVLMLWLYATSFYADVVFFWKNKLNRFFCVIGMVTAVGTAIFLTPLDSYVTVFNDLIPIGAYILGTVMLIFFYCLIWLLPRRR